MAPSLTMKLWTQLEINVLVEIEAPAPKVWTALTRDVSKWWPISFCADPTRTKSFCWELRLGGQMYEDWGDGNGRIWWTIFKLDLVNRVLAASGNMGNGMLDEVEFRVSGEGQRTLLEIQERVTGAMDDPGSLQQGQVQGWNTLFQDAFKPYAEKVTAV